MGSSYERVFFALYVGWTSGSTLSDIPTDIFYSVCACEQYMVFDVLSCCVNKLTYSRVACPWGSSVKQRRIPLLTCACGLLYFWKLKKRKSLSIFKKKTF